MPNGRFAYAHLLNTHLTPLRRLFLDRSPPHFLSAAAPRRFEAGVCKQTSGGHLPSFRAAARIPACASSRSCRHYYVHAPAGSKTAYNSSNSPVNPFPAPDLNRVPLAQSDVTGASFATTDVAAAAEPELTLTADSAVQRHDLLIMTTGFAVDPSFKTESNSLIRNT